MKQILPTLILIALLAGCGKQHEPSSSESPVPETESPSQASESSAELEELSALLKGGAQDVKLDVDERSRIEALLKLVLPDSQYIGSDKEWDVSYNDMDQGDFFQVDLRIKGEDYSERLMWFHILYQQEKPSFYGSEDFGKYRGMGYENVHYFILVENLEIRAVANAEAYKDDAKIKGMLEAFKLEDIEKL